MHNVKTKFSNPKRYHCSAGSRYENTYQEEIDKKSGRKVLVKTGKTCVYDMIQENLEASKIENIIHKLAMNDFSVLKEANLTYVDADEYPHNLMEAQNIVIKAKQEFDKFPPEVKKEFNNSAEQYISEMGTEEFNKKMSPFNDELAKKINLEKEKEFNNKVNETVTFNKAVNKAMEGEN